MKIVFLDSETLGDTSLEPVSKLGTLVSYPRTGAEETLERVKDAEVVISNKVLITEEVIRSAKNLKLICVAATGTNNIDMKAAEERGIPVRNVAAYSTASVAQTTFMHILNLYGKPGHFDGYVKDGSYSRSGLFTDPGTVFNELSGKTIGIIGMGAIGGEVAKIASAFGMDVIYYSTSGTSHCTGYPSVSLKKLLETSDVVSIHCPLNERTRGMIGDEELHSMKRSAIIVNAARGNIIDERALADAISDGTIAGAALDVFSTEPLPADNPLLHTSRPERLRFTPHIAWASAEAKERLVAGIAANISKGF
ncbi:MAG: D-2-hydroxyacid dehydrogenase [Bacteroidales bacterium]|nr:D-2-hydroxyacid dehydrogenase [Bacteroidales bacterium]